MDAVERLSREWIDMPVATDHVQRYRWAGELVRGQRVLALCCGVGYGSLMLAELAAHVHAVDAGEDTIRVARDHAGDIDNLTFEAADALEVVRRDLRGRYDAVVCFEVIEHVDRPDDLIDALTRFADAGGRVVASVANRAALADEPHVSDFDYDAAMRLWDRFPDRRGFLQFAAEGAIVMDANLSDDLQPTTASLVLGERGEAGYANAFLVAVNVPQDALQSALASMRFTIAPHHNRALRSLQRSNAELWQANRQLGRQIDEIRAQLADGEPPVSAIRLGRTSAASALAKLADERAAIVAERDAVTEERDGIRSLIEAHGDPRRIPELVEERDRLGAERGQAWQRYEELRSRKIVRIALALSRLRPRR